MRKVTVVGRRLHVDRTGDVAIVLHESLSGWAARVGRDWRTSDPPPVWLAEVREPLDRVIDGWEA